MISTNPAREKRFLVEFDANFPYRNGLKSNFLINKGWSISYNSAFCVLHEICRPPRSSNVSQHRLLELLYCWKRSGLPAAFGPAVRAAEVLIHKKWLSRRSAIKGMKALSTLPHQHAALAVLYFAANPWDETKSVSLDRVYDSVRAKWGEPALHV